VTNTAYTAFGKANPRFAGSEAAPPVVLYENMLELCEKLFGSEIDQGVFEDGVRALFGNKAYHIFTIDKVLSALVKTVWSLIDSNREAYSSNGEIFKLLVDDRRYPTTAQAQQISYRVNAELAAGSEENLYRIEWMPRRHLITFQLLGKDELLPEDEKDLSKLWERYIESYVADDVTKELAVEPATIAKGAYLGRNLRTPRKALPQLVARSELESRICMRSYKMFWQAGTEDAMHRAWSESDDDGHEHGQQLEKTAAARKARFAKWLEKKEGVEPGFGRQPAGSTSATGDAMSTATDTDTKMDEQQGKSRSASASVPPPTAASPAPVVAASPSGATAQATAADPAPAEKTEKHTAASEGNQHAAQASAASAQAQEGSTTVPAATEGGKGKEGEDTVMADA